jgi:hypothetical protein
MMLTNDIVATLSSDISWSLYYLQRGRPDIIGIRFVKDCIIITHFIADSIFILCLTLNEFSYSISYSKLVSFFFDKSSLASSSNQLPAQLIT